jgi:sugar lactone lactonase YvrE
VHYARRAILIFASLSWGIALGASQPSSPSVTLIQPNGIAVAGDGSVYITDIAGHRLLKRDSTGATRVLAGTGAGGYNADGIPAVKARLFAPHDVAVAKDGGILIADTYNHRLRRIDSKGFISTIAGNGKSAYTGDGGPAAKASLNNPQGLAIAPNQSLYIADTYNHVVRRVDAGGIIGTFAGTSAGLAGDGGPAVKAQLSLPSGITVAADGSVVICDAGNNRLRRVRPDGIIETIVGTGPGTGTAGAGFSGDSGPALQARIFGPTDVEFDAAGDLWFTDSGNHRVRRISKGVITTAAGSGDTTVLSAPQKLAFDKNELLYVADRGNRRVRVIDQSGKIDSLSLKPSR